MAELANTYAANPLVVSLRLHSRDDEGHIRYTLELRSSAEGLRVIASCSEQFTAIDFERLASGLADLAAGKAQAWNYAPVEPTFFLRASRVAPDLVELLWVIDTGFVANQYSTDTGVGLLLMADPQELEAFARALRDEAAALPPD